MNLAQELSGPRKRFDVLKNAMMAEMAEAVKAHTDRAFQAEGYTASAYTRWKKKKRYDGFKILHGETDTLNKGTYIAVKAFPTLIVKNDTAYADYHNDGEGVAERHFMDSGPGESPALDRKLNEIMDRHMHQILTKSG